MTPVTYSVTPASGTSSTRKEDSQGELPEVKQLWAPPCQRVDSSRLCHVSQALRPKPLMTLAPQMEASRTTRAAPNGPNSLSAASLAPPQQQHKNLAGCHSQPHEKKAPLQRTWNTKASAWHRPQGLWLGSSTSLCLFPPWFCSERVLSTSEDHFLGSVTSFSIFPGNFPAKPVHRGPYPHMTSTSPLNAGAPTIPLPRTTPVSMVIQSE